MFQESMNTFMQMFNIPHSYAQEGMRLAQEDARNPAGRDTGPSKEDPEEKLRAIFFLATHVSDLL
jgi:hypothetical protein